MVTYLPADSKQNAEAFLNIVEPALVLWVKYEYWYSFIHALHQRQIPVILFAARFRQGQPFFKPYGSLWKQMLQSFSNIFVQDEASLQLLATIGINHAEAAGDTRFDRVIAVKDAFENLPISIENFCRDKKVIVAGSTWQDDEMLFTHLVNNRPDIHYIIVPHEVHDDHIIDIKKNWPQAMLYTQQTEFNTSNILIIDTVGMLNRLYHYAGLCYIGGGFNDSGIHNTLEAAVYGKPVIFGPVYEKFIEACGLIENGAAISVANAMELEAAVEKIFADDALQQTMGKAAANYVQQNKGATEKIMDYIAEKRLLTK